MMSNYENKEVRKSLSLYSEIGILLSFQNMTNIKASKGIEGKIKDSRKKRFYPYFKLFNFTIFLYRLHLTLRC